MHLHHNKLMPWAYLLILAAIVFEVVWYLLVRNRRYPWREMLTSVVMFVMRFPARLLRAVIVGPVALFLWSHRLLTVPLNTFWGLGLLFLGTEFTYYWSHRFDHEVRWMWASHIVHHTPETIHFASAFRLSATEVISGSWIFHLPLYLLGFNPLAVAGMLSLNLFYQFWLHTDLIGRLGPLERVFNTPSHHRVHHASNTEYLDRNYGGILIVWDRLFGTFAAEQPQTPLVYGLVHPLGSLNPFRVQFSEWRAIARDVSRARTWRERFTQLFGRPADSLANPVQPRFPIPPQVYGPPEPL
jgi:sterol desaturase/sphingolipid hydroxylase (fatty acid hydroxylase superfamily)